MAVVPLWSLAAEKLYRLSAVARQHVYTYLSLSLPTYWLPCHGYWLDKGLFQNKQMQLFPVRWGGVCEGCRSWGSAFIQLLFYLESPKAPTHELW